MGKITLLPETTKNPITLIGERAGICWGADISDPVKNYKRGLDCINSNHGRTFEYVNVELVLENYSARVIREWYTHIGGSPTRLQASTRYIDYNDFDFVVPPKIKNNDVALAEYKAGISYIKKYCRHLIDLGIPREDVAMLLPLGMTTKVIDKRNLRNIIDMTGNRMCTRAYWEFRDLMKDLCNALSEYSEEWAYLAQTQFKAKCDKLGYCPEKHSCGKYKK